MFVISAGGVLILTENNKSFSILAPARYSPDNLMAHTSVRERIGSTCDVHRKNPDVCRNYFEKIKYPRFWVGGNFKIKCKSKIGSCQTVQYFSFVRCCYQS